MRKKALTLSLFTASTMVASPALAQVDAPVDEATEAVTDIGTGDAVVQMTTPVSAAVLPGQDAWVNFMWVGDAALEAREFQVTAVGSEGVEVGYPADHEEQPRPYSSLYLSSVLGNLGYDFTALKLVVSPSAVDPEVALTVSYVSDTGPVTQTFISKIDIDTSVYEGQALELSDGLLGTINQGEAAWLALDVTALHNASEIEVRVAGNADFGVKYPNEVDYSSLAMGSRIVVGSEDYAAIEFDSLDLEPGVYSVPIEVSYFVGLTKITQTVERSIEVIGSTTTTDPVDPDPVDPGPVDPDPVDPDPVDPGPVDPDPVLYTMANGIEGWTVDPFGNDTAVTGVWGFGQPPTGIWQDLVLELGSTPSGNPGLFTLSGTGDEMGDHDVDGGETSILSPVFSLPDVKKIKLEFDYYLSYLRNATSDDSLQVIMLTEDGNKVILNELAKDKDHEAKWETEKVDLKKYAGQDVQFLIVVGDRATPSFIEAAIDGFIITAE